MSQLPTPRDRRVSAELQERPWRGGPTGFALVALATLAICVGGAVLVGLAFLLVA